MTGRVSAGVIGAGNMGRHHARVYAELPGVNLVGVCDVDESRAAEVADAYAVPALDRDALLARADAVSVVVPTDYHFSVAVDAIDAGVHVLVEKPFVADPADGEELIQRADDAGVVLQVGHVERFNPAVTTLADVVDDLDVLAVDAQRLGPPQADDAATAADGAVLDLMIHDVDLVLALVGGDVARVDATEIAGGRYATATLGLDGGVTATLTASRVTMRKVRRLSVTARDRLVEVDYIDQSVRIHRSAAPEYVAADDGVRHRDSTVVERPTIDNGEPLRRELDAFVDATRTGGPPPVTGADGLRALRVTQAISDAARAPTDSTADEAIDRGPVSDAEVDAW